MKSVITAICLLIPLVIIVVIIDRKDFYSGEDMAIQQDAVTERNPTMVATLMPVEQPTETKPEEVKSVETMVVETSPTMLKPVETKLVETKPVEMKYAGTKPVVETKPVAEEKLAPAAIPVVTAEEGKKLNEFAIFLAGIKTTVVEGEITERSELPDPQESDYPNCRFTVHFNGNSIKSGEPCPKEIVLVVEGFSNYKVLDTDSVTTGDKIECSIIPFDALPEDYKSTQQVDDLDLLFLDNYYVIDLKKIISFTDNAITPKSGIFFSIGGEEYISIFDRHLNDPISTKAKSMQDSDIQNDIRKMNNLLSGYTNERIRETNIRFSEVWNEEKMKDPSGYNRVDNYVWRNIDNSFWSLPDKYCFLSEPERLSEDELKCFNALKEACESNGVQIIISLVPYYYDISSRVINPKYRDIPDLQTATFVKQLSEIGIESIYSTDAIIRNYNRFPFAFFFPKNSHPSDTTQDVITDILAERLKRYDIDPVLDPALFSIKQSPHVYQDQEQYLFPKDCDIGENEPGKPYTCREVLYNKNQIAKTNNAPIMVIGNSFSQTPMSTPESLPTLISMKCLSPVDFFRVDSIGPFTSIITQILANPQRFFAQKKVLIIQFGTKHLTKEYLKGVKMVNIREQDANRIMLNQKRVVFTFDSLYSSENIDVTKNFTNNKNLNEKNFIYSIQNNGETHIANFSLESIIDPTSSIVVMIPAICSYMHAASLVCNGQKKAIPTFYQDPIFSFISFELPAGTKQISVHAEGEQGNIFAIKNIQIWQQQK